MISALYDFRHAGAVQIATDNLRAYSFHIRTHFGYEGYSYGTETKIFGEPMVPDGTLAALGRNEGVRILKTAERNDTLDPCVLLKECICSLEHDQVGIPAATDQ